MKAFVKYLISIIVIVVLMLVLLDVIYTKTYSNFYSKSKFQFFRSYKNKSVDYVFLGSSRVENGINPTIIDSITKSNSVNFAVQSSKIADILVMLKMLDAYNIKYKKVFIQIDYIYNLDKQYSNILNYEFIPFYYSDGIIRNHLNSSSKFNKLQLSFPFLRYSLYDQKNGIRVLISNLKNKPSIYSYNKGFIEIYETTNNIESKEALPNNILDLNTDFENLKAYVLAKNIDVTYFIAPIKSNTINKDYFDKLKLKIPEINDYSSYIENQEYFRDNLHLNKLGAENFSKKIANDILMKYKN